MKINTGSEKNDLRLRRFINMHKRDLHQWQKLCSHNSSRHVKSVWQCFAHRPTQLYGVGIAGDALKWVRSYLSDWNQCVQVHHLDDNTGELKSVLSAIVSIDCSILQGSVIGCIMFVTFIKELPKILNTLCVLLADNVSLFFKCKNIDNSSSVTQINKFL